MTSLGCGYNKQQNLLLSSCSTIISNQRSSNPISSSFYHLNHYILQNNLIPSRNGILYSEKYRKTTLIATLLLITSLCKTFKKVLHSFILGGGGRKKRKRKEKNPINILANSIKIYYCVIFLKYLN